MKTIRKIAVFVIAVFVLSSCVSPRPKKQSMDKSIKIALIKYEMARNIIAHKDYENLPKAFLYLKEAKQVLKNDPRVDYLLAIAYKLRKNDAMYEKYLKETLKIDKNFYDAYNALGIFYFEKKQYKKALEMFTKLINNPLYPAADVAFFNRSRVYLKLNQTQKAIDDLESAIVFSNYLNPVYFKNLIAIYIAKKDYINALKTINLMEQHEGENCYTITTRAFCFIKLKQFGQAVKTLNKIKDVSSNCFKKKEALLEEIDNDTNINN